MWGQLRGTPKKVEDIQLDEVPRLQKRKPAKPLVQYANGHPTRDDAIVAAYQSGGYSQKAIAEYFGLHYSSVSKILKGARS